MALFSSKKDKKEETKEAAPLKEDSSDEKSGIFQEKELSGILLRPRITEKATDSQQFNVYTFEVDSRATKRSITKAFQKTYKVTPIRINIAKNPAKKIWLRGKIGTKPGVKKAYVYLKEGDSIELV